MSSYFLPNPQFLVSQTCVVDENEQDMRRVKCTKSTNLKDNKGIVSKKLLLKEGCVFEILAENNRSKEKILDVLMKMNIGQLSSLTLHLS